MMERGHAEALLPLIDRVDVPVEGGFASLDRVAVTVGPGSYTGLRVGISAARAIGLAAGVPWSASRPCRPFCAPAGAGERRGLLAAAIDAARAGLLPGHRAGRADDDPAGLVACATRCG